MKQISSSDQLRKEEERVLRDLIAEHDLITKAFATFKSEIAQILGGRWLSKPIWMAQVEGGFWKALQGAGFGWIDVADQKVLIHKETDRRWSFCKPSDAPPDEKIDLTLKLQIGGHISNHDRGIVLVPQTMGSGGTGFSLEADIAVFQVVSQFCSNANPIIKNIINGDGQWVIGWHKLGFGGLRSLCELFEEFDDGKNNSLGCLARSNMSPFNPAPYSERNNAYLPEPLQPTLFRVWLKQLEYFRAQIKSPLEG